MRKTQLLTCFCSSLRRSSGASVAMKTFKTSAAKERTATRKQRESPHLGKAFPQLSRPDSIEDSSYYMLL